jgi:hypothetical protein
MLVAKAKQDLPFNLSLGQTSQMRELQYRLGWERIAPLETLVFVLRGGPVVANKFPPVVRTGAGIALTLRQRWRHWRGRQAARPLQVREVERFGAPHDRLWERVKSGYRVAVVRDASYLNWKYVEQPGQNFLRLELVNGAVEAGVAARDRTGDDVAAVAVLAFQEPDAHYPYRRARLTEVVVRPDDGELVWALFEAIRQACRQRDAHSIVFDVINQSLVRHALAFGFERRESTRVLLVSIGDEPDQAALLARDPSNWLITRGDSDIDRPW